MSGMNPDFVVHTTIRILVTFSETGNAEQDLEWENNWYLGLLRSSYDKTAFQRKETKSVILGVMVQKGIFIYLNFL